MKRGWNVRKKCGSTLIFIHMMSIKYDRKLMENKFKRKVRLIQINKYLEIYVWHSRWRNWVYQLLLDSQKSSDNKEVECGYPYRSCPSLTSKDKMVEVARSGSQLWYFKVAMQWWFMLYISMPVERGYSWNQPLWVNMMQIVLISSVTAGGKWFPDENNFNELS